MITNKKCFLAFRRKWSVWIKDLLVSVCVFVLAHSPWVHSYVKSEQYTYLVNANDRKTRRKRTNFFNIRHLLFDYMLTFRIKMYSNFLTRFPVPIVNRQTECLFLPKIVFFDRFCKNNIYIIYFSFIWFEFILGKLHWDALTWWI